MLGGNTLIAQQGFSPGTASARVVGHRAASLMRAAAVRSPQVFTVKHVQHVCHVFTVKHVQHLGQPA
eukprot:CAMPEP_0198197344 /NCGR_PEP_ID=MMETSP1445-20131203/959_1 /TAXON_ID=36898 /ORGANISM="Pyramimonas sp., Strain CCMP2087" /LENGTH=66 /DNA_ID=CAMNT_0043866609 /DNA_START=792 /DNA_END=993 /DNA_ORIENTATION=+